jgi:hypothetical protein
LPFFIKFNIILHQSRFAVDQKEENEMMTPAQEQLFRQVEIRQGKGGAYMNAPALVRHPDYGIAMVVETFRTRAKIIARDAEHVYSCMVTMQEFFNGARPMEYAKGIAEAARRFLNPALGIMRVEPEARSILEEIIMKEYTVLSAAKRGFVRAGGDPAEAETAIEKTEEGKFRFDETTIVPKISGKERLKEATAPAGKAGTKAGAKSPGGRKPGAVAAVHALCDRFRTSIEKGEITRKDIIKKAEAEKINKGTAAIQVAKWAQATGVIFSKG